MSNAYVPPGVTVQELVNPTFQPFLGEPTEICIIGPARGFDANTELVQLADRTPVTLSVPDGIDLSSVTVTSIDGTTTYIQGTATGNTGADSGRPSGDYYISGNQIVRSMQTLIDTGEQVLVYYRMDTDDPANPGSDLGVQAHQDLVTLTGSGSDVAVNLTSKGHANNTTLSTSSIQSLGIVPASNYVITYGSGSSQSTIAASVGDIFPANTGQTVYLDFTDQAGVRHVSVAVTLNSTSAVNIPGTGATTGPNPANSGQDANLIVKNVSDAVVVDTAVRYDSSPVSTALAANDNGADFTLVGDGVAPQTYSIYRPSGDRPTTDSSSTIALHDGDTVKVQYNATPSDYYLPTRCFSQNDVEDKYGPAIDATGAIQSPVSLASAFAFQNGATDLVVQALFAAQVVNGITIRTQGGVTPGNEANDWVNTLIGLRDIEDVNVLVPLVSTVGTPSDSLSRSVFQAVQDHIAYMSDQQSQYLVAICGEDSTVGSGLASASELQSTATFLGSRNYAETMTLISPGGFQYSNSKGVTTPIGGQYVAAACAGRMAGLPIQQTLTRTTVIGITGVTDFRSEADKNADASSGLMVVENKSGVIRVRQAITTGVSDPNTIELSVVRAKQYMINSVATTIDQQVIGQIVADDRAAFTVQLLVQDTLDSLVTQGAIVTYQDIQARLLTGLPTTMEVRFSYAPAFPLNYVNIIFSINTSNGTITTTTTSSGS